MRPIVAYILFMTWVCVVITIVMLNPSPRRPVRVRVPVPAPVKSPGVKVRFSANKSKGPAFVPSNAKTYRQFMILNNAYQEPTPEELIRAPLTNFNFVRYMILQKLQKWMTFIRDMIIHHDVRNPNEVPSPDSHRSLSASESPSGNQPASSKTGYKDFRNLMDDDYFLYTILPGIVITTIGIIIAVVAEFCCTHLDDPRDMGFNDGDSDGDDDRYLMERRFLRARRRRRERSLGPEPEQRPPPPPPAPAAQQLVNRRSGGG